ncbi:hypothetical protein CBF23_005675 [Marinomonas agarivorans]|nr:hypothetical protein CBF23_005675 [Marinomonas agarivorans]
MTGTDFNAHRRGFTKFVNKAFFLVVLWVAVAIAGLQYYVFHVDTHNEQIEIELSLVENSLMDLERLLLDLYSLQSQPFKNSSPTNSPDNNVQTYEQQIAVLQSVIQESLTTINLAHQGVTPIEASWVELTFDNIQANREEAKRLRRQLLEIRSFYGLVQGVSLEQLKRLLIGFGVFTSVFILLLLSSVRKRINKNNLQQGDAQDYLALKSEGQTQNDFYNKVFLYSCFQRMQEPSLVLNDKRKVIYANQAFSSLWQTDPKNVARLLRLEEGIHHDIKQLHIPSADQNNHKEYIGGLTYSYTDVAIWDGSSIIGYELKLVAESEKLEYEALSKSVALLGQDVWDAPIRILRTDSQVGVLAAELEAIRVKVQHFFEKINSLSEASSLVQVKKLQHILTLLQDIKQGEFDFDFNPHDVLKLSQKLNVTLEGASDSDITELQAFVEDLHRLCEHIINGSEPNVEHQAEIADFLNSLENGLQAFVEQVQQREESIFKKMAVRVTTLEEALQRLHDAKEVTLNAMNEGRYEEDDIDFKQFFIDDVDSQMTAAISMVDKAFVTDKAILSASESEKQDSEEKLKEVHDLCLSFTERKTDVDDLIDQVRFLARELSTFDAKIQQVAQNKSQRTSFDVDEEENGDW